MDGKKTSHKARDCPASDDDKKHPRTKAKHKDPQAPAKESDMMHLSFSKKLPRPTAVPGEISIVNMDTILPDLDKKHKRRRRKMHRERSMVEEVFYPTNKTLCFLGLGAVMIFVLLFFKETAGTPVLSEDDLQALLDNVKGNDVRLFRWDATPLTTQRRGKGGCNKLPEAVSVLMDASAPITSKTLAAEFLTFCITDAPTQRARFSRHEGVHEAVIHMVASRDPAASAMASHLIYISTFANEKNQQTYIAEGAVVALGMVVMDPNALTSQIMWASAALQNLAASYCETADDGRCYWEWTLEDNHVVIEDESLPMVSDGAVAREDMLRIDGLVEVLIKMACTGPVEGTYHPGNVFPGENTIMGRDDNNPHLIAWAATGALKNLALEPSARKQLEPVLQCMCRMKDSPDWLEQQKSNDLILFMRREQDPCWYREEENALCIDFNFVDQEHHHCDGYKSATEEECRNECVVTGVSAKEACCECGGGARYSPNTVGSLGLR